VSSLIYIIIFTIHEEEISENLKKIYLTLKRDSIKSLAASMLLFKISLWENIIFYTFLSSQLKGFFNNG